MPFPNRTAHEQAILANLLAEYAKLQEQAKRDPRSIDWTTSENEAQRETADELATVFLVALAGMHKATEQDFNQYVALSLATDYANQRSAEVVRNLYDDLRARVNEASSNAAQSVLNGIPADEAKRQYEAKLTSVFEPIRPDVIAVTEVTAAISAGEYAVGKPDKNNWWLALVLLYGVPDALEAWKNRQPGQPLRDLIGWPRMPRRRDVIEPAPTDWPTPTPRREMPTAPSDPPEGQAGPATAPQQPQFPPASPPAQSPPASIPSVLMPYWQTEGDARVCPVCSPLDGLAEDRYWNQFPGGPPAHPNCRCELRWVNAESLES